MPDPPDDGFASMTHARLRAGQGDYREAGRLLREILERDPKHVEARQLLLRIARRVDTTAAPVEQERATGAPLPADPGRLARRFREVLGRRGSARSAGDRRVRRLERWLRRIRRGA